MVSELDVPREVTSADPLTAKIIGAAIQVHRELGPGLLESAYQRCLHHELGLQNLRTQIEVPLPVLYRGLALECGYRMDLVVESSIIVEVKSVDKLLPIHESQLLTYLRLSGLRTGLLLNFNCAYLRNGIKRMVL
jgi:GxxExxY protein